MYLQPKPGAHTGISEQVRSILDSKHLTLYQVSQRSARLFGRPSRYYLPHNFYYDLKRGTFSPSLFQLFALSRISNYKLTDWLRVFGFDVEAIPRLQIQLPSARTILLDSSLDDPASLIPWLRNSHRSEAFAPVTPLSQALEWMAPRRLAAFFPVKDRGFLYAKIGHRDALAFPELLAGSIVRVDPRITDDQLPKSNGAVSRRLFLVEHSAGLFCCNIRSSEKAHIATVSTQLPYVELHFRVPAEARLIGVADMEIRNILAPEQPRLAEELARAGGSELTQPTRPVLGSLLRSARLKTGLSFRAASAMSREVANLLDDESYYTSPGSLSDYEVVENPPRHFHKIITFCLVYSLQLNAVLDALDLSPQKAGTESIPDRFVGRASPPGFGESPEMPGVPPSGVLGELLRELTEIPFFLRGALSPISNLKRPSLRDFFWIGGVRKASHPSLTGGLLAIVNRHKKRLNDCSSKPPWQQPLFMILKRDGTYLCACCNWKNHRLLVHSYSGRSHKTEVFRDGDAEIIGQIVTVVRKLS